MKIVRIVRYICRNNQLDNAMFLFNTFMASRGRARARL
jgi:hypothetical protein